MITRPDKLSERGWALVSVLWVLSILALLAAATQSLTLTSSMGERSADDRAEIDALLDAGVARAVGGISDSRADSRWRVDGSPYAFSFAGQKLHIAIQDEFGKIDLNAADGSLLRQLLLSASETPDDAAALVNNILEWRSAIGLTQLHGASDSDYAAAGRRPRHGPFQTIDELQLVIGMNPVLYGKIRPALTVYSKRPAIDTASAPRAALLAYFPNQPDRVESLLKLRSGTQALLSSSDAAAAGRIYTISVGLDRAGRHALREVVLEFTNDPVRPYLVLSWR